MTDVAAPSPPAGARAIAGQSPALAPPHAGEGRRKHVNTQATSRSLRHLAREAAERGERLVEISRRLQISPSTIHHWAKADGFRRKDIKARASLSAGPVMPGKADYPELKDMAPRARLERLHELSGMARLRAIAAVEEGFVDYGLKWLREAQKLERGWTVLREHLADYPPPEEEEDASWQDKALWALEEMVLAEKEGREPEFPWEEPPTSAEKAEEDRIWEIARARQPALPDDATPEARVAAEMEVLQDVVRLEREVKKWRLLPGHGDPPFLRAVDRGRSDLPEVEESPSPPLAGERGWGEGVARDQKSHGDFPSDERMTLSTSPSQPSPPAPLTQAGEGSQSGGRRLYGMDDAFPVRFPVRRE